MKFLKNIVNKLGMVVQACNCSYSGGRNWKIMNSMLSLAKLARHYLKNKIRRKGLGHRLSVRVLY
jgi:hypothetical protein